jgi:hypothetical protein
MHMAMAYDYHEVVYALIDHGADVTVTNDAGFPASRGLEGDKSLALLALVAAKDEAAVIAAMNLCGEKGNREYDRATLFRTTLLPTHICFAVSAQFPFLFTSLFITNQTAAALVCLFVVDEVEKSAFIALCLGRKKELGQEIWTDAVKAKMTETMDKLPTK